MVTFGVSAMAADKLVIKSSDVHGDGYPTDPVHFGIIMMLNLSIGLVTPPVGSTLFVGCAIGNVSIERVSRKLWPFWLSMFAILMLVTYFPWFSMWVPSIWR